MVSSHLSFTEKAAEFSKYWDEMTSEDASGAGRLVRSRV